MINANMVVFGQTLTNGKTTMVEQFLQAAIEQAKIGESEGGIPIGSVLVYKNKIIGRGFNRRIQKGSVILHAEMDALENAKRQPASVYRECILYTTLFPCSMCSGAILLYGIPIVKIGENKNFKGDKEILKIFEKKKVIIDVLNNHECFELLKKFIENNPEAWNEDIGK